MVADCPMHQKGTGCNTGSALGLCCAERCMVVVTDVQDELVPESSALEEVEIYASSNIGNCDGQQGM